MKFKTTKKCVICNHEYQTKTDRRKCCSTECSRQHAKNYQHDYDSNPEVKKKREKSYEKYRQTEKCRSAQKKYSQTEKCKVMRKANRERKKNND